MSALKLCRNELASDDFLPAVTHNYDNDGSINCEISAHRSTFDIRQLMQGFLTRVMRRQYLGKVVGDVLDYLLAEPA